MRGVVKSPALKQRVDHAAELLLGRDESVERRSIGRPPEQEKARAAILPGGWTSICPSARLGVSIRLCQIRILGLAVSLIGSLIVDLAKAERGVAEAEPSCSSQQ